MHKIAILNLRLLVAGLFLSTLATNAHDVVEWCNDTNIHKDVVDKNIVVSGKNVVQGAVAVKALNKDVHVEVIGNATIAGRNEESRLFLQACAGRKITVNVDHDLLFKGSKHADFLVAVEGAGEVAFITKGGRELTFTAKKRMFGVQLLVVMDEKCPPTLLFGRADECPDKNVNITVGPNSCISYVAHTRVDSGCAKETGTIAFDPSSRGTGCMFLNVQNCSSVLVQGRWVKGKGEFRLEDISKKVPAGHEARMRVYNSRGAAATAALRVVNENKKLSALLIDPFGDRAYKKEKGHQVGFIVGANGKLQVDDLSYLDYIGVRLNVVPDADLKCIDTCAEEGDPDNDAPVAECVKERNPSALIIDGNKNKHAVPAHICLNGRSAIYFRSGVDNAGHVNSSFTVDPNNLTPGFGNIVLDVEGALCVKGQTDFTNPSNSGAENALQILSLDVAKCGGTVFSESQDDPNQPKQFPKRTFCRDKCDRLIRYNKAAFLINNHMKISRAALMHTDENHTIVDESLNQKPDVASEPTYVGGEATKLSKKAKRPAISFCNAEFKLQTSAAVTGLDLRVPNKECGNTSYFKFYSNGYCVDAGSGRFLVLGTSVGSTAADGCNIIDRDAHLDVMQVTDQCKASDHRLLLTTGFNNKCITQAIGDRDITDPAQCSVQTIFLGNRSNISVGSPKDPCLSDCLVTKPELLVKGDFFSFETRGGAAASPEVASLTGEGAIFVDNNGTFGVCPCCRASVSTMVVKNGNGVVDLPKSRVLFDCRVGITDWDIDLTCPADRVIVGKNDCFSDYTLDWAAVTKDCCRFLPYEPKGAPAACQCPPVTMQNVSAIPTVKGQVNQFQIVRSRLGDQAHVRVSGGRIRELVFQKGFFTSDAAVGFIVLDNFGRVGLNTAHTSQDSIGAQMVLGVNGVTICADGDGVVDVNEDLVINNNCAILRGPNFKEGQKLTFFADEDHTILVKSTGTLDLTSFTNPGEVVEFAGKVQVVFEPGARIALNGGTLQFADQASLVLQSPFKPSDLHCMPIEKYNAQRVRIVGCGDICMKNDAFATIPQSTFLAVESDPSCGCGVADITWTLKDNARVQMGSNGNPGGSFQVGNLTDLSDGMEAQLVSFNLVLDGFNTAFEVGPLGFLGFGAHTTNKAPGLVPNNWQLECLHNINNVQVNVRRGSFIHRQTYALDDALASLFAIGYARVLNDQGLVVSTGSYTFLYNEPFVDPFKARVLGGGNLVFLADCQVPVTVQNLPTEDLALFASKDLLNDGNQNPIPSDIVNVDPSVLFNFLRVKDLAEMQTRRATFVDVAPLVQDDFILGFVCEGEIRRQNVAFINGSPTVSLLRGAVALAPTLTCDIQAADVFQI